MSSLSSIPEILDEIRAGRPVIVVDGPERENEGDFFIPAEMITPALVNLFITRGRGLLCVAIERAQAMRLHIPLMVARRHNTEKTGVNFGVSVNASKLGSSGISAYDRAETIRVLAGREAEPSDLTRPGHVFPLVAHDGGLLARDGHTEAAVTLAKLAGTNAAGVLCEIIGDDGHMSRLPALTILAQELGLKIVSIADLKEYLYGHPLPEQKHQKITKTASAMLPTRYGKFKISVYKSFNDDHEHVALVLGDDRAPALTRIHSKCLTGDTFGSLTCDCGAQLEKSLQLISKAGKGILLYLDQEGRGIGLSNKIRAYALQQEEGLDTVEANTALGFGADERDFEIAAEILHGLGAHDITLLTNNPAKLEALEQFGIHAKRVSLDINPTQESKGYLETKKHKLRHL